jgi:hypothetical protein
MQMSGSKFATQAASNPTRYYARPNDAVADSRLSRIEKLAVLEAWELEARALAVAAEENMTGGEPDRLQQVVEARIALGVEADPVDNETGASTKAGVRRVRP